MRGSVRVLATFNIQGGCRSTRELPQLLNALDCNASDVPWWAPLSTAWAYASDSPTMSTANHSKSCLYSNCVRRKPATVVRFPE